MRALSLNCSVARGNQCGGGEGFTSSPICRVTKILVQGCNIGCLLKELLRISQLWMPNKRLTISNRSQRITILGGVNVQRQTSTREDGNW